MNKILVLLALVSLCLSSRAEQESLEAARSRYADLASQHTNCITWIKPIDETFIRQIEEGMAFSDESINASLITMVHMNAALFAPATPFEKRTKNLAALRSIKGLKEFLTAQLAHEPPKDHTIYSAAILYGKYPDISNRLVELYTRGNDFKVRVMMALWSGNLSDLKFKPIVLEAIASDDPLLAQAAAQYLTNNPIPEALPALIKQYQRTDSSLNLKPAENLKPPSKPVDPYDVWRMLVGSAVRAYDPDALLEFATKLKSIEDTVTFGRMSGLTYQGILRKIEKYQRPN